MSKVLRTSVSAVLGIVAITLVLMWLMGAFHDKVEGTAWHEVLPLADADAPTLEVRAEAAPVVETAVGTVEATQRIRVGSRLLARVEKVHVRPSQRVAEGEILVELDPRDLRAAVAEAKAALDQAKAALVQAETDLKRSEELLARNVATGDRVERDTTAKQRAAAEVRRRQEALHRAETGLGFATVRAPSAGIVIDKHVEPGNLATPGQDLVTLYDPARLQLVARVREGLATRLRPGTAVRVRLDALDQECPAEIARVVPEASPASRSFRVEVTGPCPPGVLSGMFGRLLVDTGTRQVIRVPVAALRRSGQIDLAFVVRPDRRVLRRFVRVGATDGEQIEILAGLAPGDVILARAPTRR